MVVEEKTCKEKMMIHKLHHQFAQPSAIIKKSNELMKNAISVLKISVKSMKFVRDSYKTNGISSLDKAI